MSHGGAPRSKTYVRITIIFAAITIVMLLIAFHPFNLFVEDESVEITVLMPFTGDQKEFGIAYSRGVAIAAQEVNERGGIGGKKINVEYYDYGGDLTEIKTQFYDAFDRNAHVVIGPLTSSEALEVAPYAEMFEIVVISPSATSADLTKYEKYFYRTVPSDAYLGIGVAKIFGNSKAVSNIMVIYTDDSYGIGLKDSLKEEIEHTFTEKSVVSEYMLTDDDEYDTEQIILEMKNKNVDGVFIIVNSPSKLISILNGAENAGIYPIWIGTDNSITDDISEVGEYADGFMACVPSQSSTDPLFESRFYKKFQTTSGISNAVYGYDTLMMVVETMESEGYSGKEILEGLNKIRYVGLTGAIKFDEHGDRYPSYDVMQYSFYNDEWSTLKWSKMLDFSSSASGHHEE